MTRNSLGSVLRISSGMVDFLRLWWREATGPFALSQHRNVFEAVLRRVMLWVPVVALIAALSGALGFYFFTGWRARDLAVKAMDNALAGNLQMARLQVISARGLRSGDPTVKRTMLYVQSRLNDPDALPLWEEFAGREKPTDTESAEWSRLAMLFGSDEQFARANAALTESGMDAEAAALRSARQLQRGNLAQSIAEARGAASQSGDAVGKLALLRLLLARHVPVLASRTRTGPSDLQGRDEIVALTDELLETPRGNEAIAMVLGAFPQPEEMARRWAEAGLRDRSPSNPALLPSARFLVATGQRTPEECLAMLSPVFAGASDDQRALFGRWLNFHQMWDETLTRISPETATRHALAFEERGRALAGREQWKELLAMVDAPSQAPDSLRCIYRGLAARKLGRIGIAPKALADAVRAGVREGRLPQTLAALDAIGESEAAAPILVEMCSTPGHAESVFRVARDRFERLGQFSSLSAAFAAASNAAPDAPPVRDLRWRRELLAGLLIDTAATAAAAAASPADPQLRLTHALALLKAGYPAGALRTFHDIDVFVDQLAPGDKAIVIALLEANGMGDLARSVRQSLNPDLLQQGEYALICGSASPPPVDP